VISPGALVPREREHVCGPAREDWKAVTLFSVVVPGKLRRREATDGRVMDEWQRYTPGVIPGRAVRREPGIRNRGWEYGFSDAQLRI